MQDGSGRWLALAGIALALAGGLALMLGRGPDRAPVRPTGVAPGAPGPGAAPPTPDEPAPAAARSAVAAAAATPTDAPTLADAPVDELPPASGPLVGRVVDEAGAPVAGARVAARFLATREFSMLDLEAKKAEREVAADTTGDDGRFALEVPAAHPLDVEARRAGLGTALRRGAYAGEQLELVMTRGATFAGRVVRADDGRPVAGVALRGWSPEGHGERFRGESGPDGSFRFADLPPGPLRYEVAPEDLAAPEWVTVELAPGEVLERTIALEAGVAVSGRVTDAATGAPIAEAEVWEGWTGRKRVRTAADGSYRLAGFGGPGVYEVHVHAAGYGNAAHEFPYLDLPREDVTLDFELPPARRARGRVVDRAGAPVPGAYVAAVHSSFVGAEQVTDWEATRSEADGHYTLPSLHPDLPHALFVRKPGFATVIYDFPAGEREAPEVVLPDVVLPPPARLEGRVVDEAGAPRAGLNVALEGWNADFRALADGAPQAMEAGILDGYVGEREAKSDSRGRFAFADLAAGSYRLQAKAKGGSDGVVRHVEVAEAAWVRELELVLPRGLSITGRVLGPDGRGLPQVLVRAKSEETGVDHRATSGAGGAFELVGLAPERYTLVGDPMFLEDGDAGPTLAEAVHRGVAAGGPPVELTLPAAARVEGVVLGADGAPFPRAFVFAHDAEGRQVGWDVADEGGAFALDVAPGGALRVEAWPTAASEDSPFGADPVGAEADRARLEGVRPPAAGLTLRLPAHSG